MENLGREMVINLKLWQRFLLKIFKNKTTKNDPSKQIHHYEKDHEQSKDNRQMHARVVYEYPKGEFRFPLIKDEEEIVQKENDQQNNEQRHNEQQIPKQEPFFEEAEFIPTQRKIKPKNNQPFTPTHIPSPIYGFHRPKRKEASVINDGDTFHNESEQLAEIDIAKSDQLSVFQQKHEIRKNIEVHAEKTVQEDHDQQSTPPLDVQEQQYKEKVTPLSEEVDSPIQRSEKLSEKEQDAKGEQVEKIESDLPEAKKSNEQKSEVTIVEREDLAQEIKEVKDRPKRKESRTKERSNLPFNVMMLSKDRANWEKQKRREQRKEKERVANEIVATSQAAATDQKEDSNAKDYEFPTMQLLKPPIAQSENKEWLNEQAILLDETLGSFNVKAHVVGASQGPSVTRFEVQPDRGVKVNRITNLSDDIKLSMAARDIRIEAPIPGKRSVGIELPNNESRPVQISEIIGSDAFSQNDSPLTAVLGLDISGKPVVTDLKEMPHGLIAGATGSGKSVCINSIIVSLLYKAKPDEVKLLLIDPKMVELASYNHIPHLVSPVITDVKAATASLKWAVEEMERRYELFAYASVRDLNRYNELAKESGKRLPYIVIVIDELADLMMMAPADVEESICRIAQKARACGIHLLIATQRPSVDVITGLIKANVPTRIAFSVSSQVDSRTVIDIGGAEKLLGRGDMLFLENGTSKPVRLQGTFVSDDEIDLVIEHVRSQGKPKYLFEQEELLKKAEIEENEDELFVEACEFVINHGNASTSLLQRQFRIGYNRAARLIAVMEEQGLVSEARGSRPRDVLMDETDLNL